MAVTRLIHLCLVLLVCAVGASRLLAASPQRAARDAVYAEQLRQLADRCETLGLTSQAELTRRWFIPRDPGRQYLFVPRAADPTRPAADAPLVEQQWHQKLMQLRREQAEALFQYARAELEAGRATLAYQLLHEVLREDPQHAEATHILGGRRFGNDVAVRVRTGTATHPQFQWPRGEYWRIDSPHFRITTNHSGEAGRAIAEQLELLYAAWQQLFFPFWSTPEALAERFAGRAAVLGRPRRHEVVLFRDRENYVTTLSAVEPQIAISTGYYHKGRQTAFFYVGERLRATWFHESTHQLFQENGGIDDVGERWNFWLVEGIALYMESLVPYDGYLTAGGFDASRLQFARAQRLGGESHLPFDQLVVLGREQLQQHDEIGKIYTQAAGLTHFLMDFDSGRYRSALIQFLQLLYQGRDQTGTLLQLLAAPAATLDSQYADYLQVTDADLQYIGPPDEVVHISLGHTAVTDAGLARLSEHHQLEWLDLASTAATDAGIAALGEQPELRQLSLEATRISDAAMTHVAGWTGLEELDLAGTQITDRGGTLLGRLPQLRAVWLTGTKVGQPTVDVLRTLRQLEFVDLGATRVAPEVWQALQQDIESP